LSNEDLKSKERIDLVVNGETAESVDVPSLESESVSTEKLAADPLSDLATESAALALVGSTFAGRFEILSVLGSGGMSTVYKAKHLLLDRFVAVKVILAGQLHPKAVRRFQQEAKTATALNHPNIATVREFGQDPSGCLYLVMDFVEGITLSDAIKETGSLSPERVEKIISQVCDGLKHAHDNGVIHRDLKPANIILSNGPDGETPKIVDFGIAKLVSEENQSNLTQTGEMFGTPNYMSPEQCLGKPVDKRSDIYSMGCVTYECVTGAPPFASESVLATLASHVSESPDFSSFKWQNNLRNAVERSLEKAPEDRWQSIDEFAQCLQEKDARPREQRKQKGNKKVGPRSFLLICVIATILSALAATAYTIYPLVNKAFFPAPWMALQRQANAEMAIGPSNYTNARVLLKRALAEADAKGAPDKDKEDIFIQLARLCVASNDEDSAVKYFETALKLNLLHAEDFNRGSIHEWLSGIYLDKKDYPKAVEEARTAVAIKDRVIGRNQHLTLTSMFKLGQALRQNGNCQEAEKVDRDILAVAQKLYPRNDNVDVANAHYQLANILTRTGTIEEAGSHYMKSVLISQALLGPDHPQTVSNRNHTLEYIQKYGHRDQKEVNDFKRALVIGD
jgi:serine/threonine protein kinase